MINRPNFHLSINILEATRTPCIFRQIQFAFIILDLSFLIIFISSVIKKISHTLSSIFKNYI